MALKPYVAKFLEGNPLAGLTTVEDLINYRGTVREILPPVEARPQVQAIENRTIEGSDGHAVPVRIYTPAGEGPFPLFVFFHGGGFAVGDVEEYDVLCRILTLKTGAKVISVDYRLAPEHKFPAAPEDCYTAAKWAFEHAEELNGDPYNLIVGGDSAGGTLTAAVTQMARDRKSIKIAKQILMYPVMDFHSLDFPSVYPSYSVNAEGFGVTSTHMGLFWDLYLENKEDRNHPYASPISAAELKDLPPALLFTSEYDVLRDEGEQYGRRLHESGVPVMAKRFNGMIHGFLQFFVDKDAALEALDMINAFVQDKTLISSR
ncbi:acetyl esterase [Neobacillus niacini]|uniref:alpha/beta hydrolase n=1 Tax=Neobacillus niacini TaxID=86668 RepID=UPI0027817DD6|nr:alpha/beta hydrolase [Neobacillus niacini]MDQ1002686.1 acetyl esterase [Neobacillus niacini]